MPTRELDIHTVKKCRGGGELGATARPAPRLASWAPRGGTAAGLP